jgi:serine/threonine protein kinase
VYALTGTIAKAIHGEVNLAYPVFSSSSASTPTPTSTSASADGHHNLVKGHPRAIKITKLQSRLSAGDNPAREVKILEEISTDSKPYIHEVVVSDTHQYAVMPYHGGGELLDQIIDGRPLAEVECKRYLKMVAQELQYLHTQHSICHRDLSLENVMLDGDGKTHIIDFGLATKVSPNERGCQRGIVGKTLYMAPEVKAGGSYDGFAADIWALGVMAFGMLTGAIPSWCEMAGVQLYKGGVGSMLKAWQITHLSAEVVDLLNAMLTADPLRRINIGSICKHPWLSV